MKGKERIEQQLLQLRDMVEDHKRMVLVDLQPTDDERADVLALVRSIRDGIQALPHDTASQLRRGYETAAGQVRELKYADADALTLVIREPEHESSSRESSARAATSAPISSLSPEPEPRSHPGKKTVRFNDLLEQRYTDEPRDDAQDQVQLYNENEQLFEDQDRRLGEMSLSVNRQRDLGLSINQELGTHNELLNDLEIQTDASQSRLDRATHGVVMFNRKARECGTCSIIMALVLILLIVIII